MFGSGAYIIELSVEDLCEEKIARVLQRLLLITVTVVLGLRFMTSFFFFCSCFLRFGMSGHFSFFVFFCNNTTCMQCLGLLFALLYRQ